MKILADQRSIWAAALFGAVILGGGLFLLIWSAPIGQEPTLPPKTPAVPNLAVKKVVSGEAALLDKTPLFLPTDWNTATKEISLPKSGGIFSEYPATFAFSEIEVGFGALRSGDALSMEVARDLDAPGSTALGFGRKPGSNESPAPRGGYLEILAAKEGTPVLREVLVLVPPLKKALVWRPIELMAVVGPAGLSGPLIFVARSGSDEVDAYFSEFLVRKFKLGEKLPPGIYRLIVGP